MSGSPAPSTEGTEISIPRAKRKVVSGVVAGALCIASLGIGFAGGRLTAPEGTSAPFSVPSNLPSGFPSPPAGFPSGIPSGFPSPPAG